MNKFLLTLLLTVSMQASFAQNKVIYGEDNRLDLYEVTDPMLQELALSTAAMIAKDRLEQDGNFYDITADTLADYGVCSGERFTEQLMPANCSGFLVGDDVLVTAGHCIQTMADCNKSNWVFDFAIAHEGDDVSRVKASSVYSCKEIISRELNDYTMNDFAIIRLDRKVTDRAPLRFRTEGKIEVGTPIVVIGHPTGLPTKVSAGANVRSVNDVYFVANLDTFGGNSGSAVFNTETGEIEGILVRGERDYRYDYGRGCYVPNQCNNDECRGEDSTLITNLNLNSILNN